MILLLEPHLSHPNVVREEVGERRETSSIVLIRCSNKKNLIDALPCVRDELQPPPVLFSHCIYLHIKITCAVAAIAAREGRACYCCAGWGLLPRVNL